MQLDEIPALSKIAPNTTVLEGKKIKINEILNLTLVFTGWKITISKYQDKETREKLKEQNEKPEQKKDDKKIKLRECLELQFIYENEKRVIFTSSGVLIQQLKDFLKAQPDATQFKACIKYVDNRFYKFAI